MPHNVNRPRYHIYLLTEAIKICDNIITSSNETKSKTLSVKFFLIYLAYLTNAIFDTKIKNIRFLLRSHI